MLCTRMARRLHFQVKRPEVAFLRRLVPRNVDANGKNRAVKFLLFLTILYVFAKNLACIFRWNRIVAHF